jgi:Arc/MetJ-type ribon-helix-helix transcriptional regulator
VSLPHQSSKLRSVDGNANWKDDPEYFSKYYLGSQTKENLGDGTSVRLDMGVQKGISHLIHSGKTPYKDQSEFLRDSALKNLRYQAEHLSDPELIRIVKTVEFYAKAIHDDKIMEMNEKLLKVRRRKLENAMTSSEVQKVLDMCMEARLAFEGKQLEELEGIIKDCRRRLG